MMAGLKRIKGKWYARIRFVENGKRKEKKYSLKTKQRAKAEKLLPNIEKREKLFKAGIISLDQIATNETPKNQPLVDEFIEYQQIKKHVCKKTVSLYNLALNALLEIFKDKNILRLNENDDLYFYKSMKSKYKNINTLNLRLRTCRTFFNWLVKKRKIKELPFEIKPFPVPKKKPKYFSNSEMETILNYLKKNKYDEVYARVYFHWKTGLRISEFHTSYIEKNILKTYAPKKGGIEREIPIDKDTTFYFLWLKDNGKYTDETISKKFLASIRELGLYKTQSGGKRSFHNLRDSFATATYYKTRDIYEVSKLLGHTSIKTTLIYTGYNRSSLDQDFGNPDQKETQPVKNKIQPDRSELKKFYIENYGANYVN